MKKRNLLIGVGSITVVLLSFMLSAYWVRTKPAPEKEERKQSTIYVKAERVSYKAIHSDLEYRGRVTAYDLVSMAAEVQGKILPGDVRFKAGENFKEGQVLINIYKEDIESAMKSGVSSFLQILSLILPDIKVDYPGEYDKWSRFFYAIDVDQPLPDLPKIHSEKEKVFLAANNILTSYYNLQQQQINLKRYSLTAPFDGAFKAVNKEIGAISSPGVELASLIRTDKMEVTVPVFPADLQWIKEGDIAMITSSRGEVKKARVSRISRFVDEATQSVNVYLNYNTSSGSGFLSGGYVDVVFKGGVAHGFEIPREALIDGDNVYKLENKKLVKTEVRVIRQLNDSYIIEGSSVDSTAIIVTESLSEINPLVSYLPR